MDGEKVKVKENDIWGDLLHGNTLINLGNPSELREQLIEDGIPSIIIGNSNKDLDVVIKPKCYPILYHSDFFYHHFNHVDRVFPWIREHFQSFFDEEKYEYYRKLGERRDEIIRDLNLIPSNFGEVSIETISYIDFLISKFNDPDGKSNARCVFVLPEKNPFEYLFHDRDTDELTAAITAEEIVMTRLLSLDKLIYEGKKIDCLFVNINRLKVY